MSAVGVKTASERLRQRSASSPASSRASGGARVCARVEEEIMTAVKCVFIGTGAALRYYTGAPGDSHPKDTWQACNSLVVVPCSHARLDCEGGRSEFFRFRVREIEHVKIDINAC